MSFELFSLRNIVVLPFVISAAYASEECWRAEGFASLDAFQQQQRDWSRENIPLPAPWNIVAAYQIYKTEQADVRKSFRNDKQMHCYMGCRIAQDVNFVTAQWAAWKKEERDLNDCNSETHFETLDYQVTVIGAHYAVTAKTKEDCRDPCIQNF